MQQHFRPPTGLSARHHTPQGAWLSLSCFFSYTKKKWREEQFTLEVPDPPKITPSLRLHDTVSLAASCLGLTASAQSLAALRRATQEPASRLDRRGPRHFPRQPNKPRISSLNAGRTKRPCRALRCSFPQGQRAADLPVAAWQGERHLAARGEGRQRRGRRIFIKITSCEACDESSVNTQRELQQACVTSSGNVNQHSPVNFDRAPRFWAAAPGSPDSLTLPWGWVNSGSHNLSGAVSMAAGHGEISGSSPGVKAASAHPGGGESSSLLRHSPSWGASVGARGHAKNWIGNGPKWKITCWKTTVISSHISSPVKHTRVTTPTAALAQGGGRCVHGNQQLESGGGLGLPLKKKYINLNAQLGLWENTNPASQLCSTFSVKHQQSKENRISNAISSPLNGSIASK